MPFVTTQKAPAIIVDYVNKCEFFMNVVMGGAT